MKFSELVHRLLSLKNASLLIKLGGGALFVQDLHKFVNDTAREVGMIKQPATSTQAKMLKAQLLTVLDNYSKASKLPPNSKRPR